MRIADRISNLGTETAFAVGAEAGAFAAQGNRVYPFHLGDINMPTPSTVVDGAAKAIADGKTGYCPAAAFCPGGATTGKHMLNWPGSAARMRTLFSCLMKS